MIGRAAYQDPWLLAELDERLFGAARCATEPASPPRSDYVAREVAAGTPLRAMTRHLLGMRNGRAGGRRWRRVLGELGEGARGLEDLRSLVGAFTEGASLSPPWMAACRNSRSVLRPPA